MRGWPLSRRARLGAACVLLFLPLGCGTCPLFTTEGPTPFFLRLEQASWWDRYEERLQPLRMDGSSLSGARQRFSCRETRLLTGTRADLLRILRTDLLELAADMGVTVHRPVRETIKDNLPQGFALDYSQGWRSGRICVEIQPGENEGTCYVTCSVDEPAPPKSEAE
jgi:hypothetical protein